MMSSTLYPQLDFHVSSEKCSNKLKAQYLLALVERVKKLDCVVVKSNIMVDDDDEMVLIPGPWAIVEPNRSVSNDIDFDVVDPETVPNTFMNTLSFARRNREPSLVSRSRSSSSVSESSKFIIRNEFGHARIQEYLARPNQRERSSSRDSTVAAEDLFETGGHVVLHPDVFRSCIEKGWGIRHPLAGHYHPITGTQIPETTMLFRASCNDQELESVWQIVLSSYTWLTQN